MPTVEHSVSTGCGTRAIATKTGVEIRAHVNGLTEEVICTVTWAQIDYLRARVLDQR